MRGGRRRGGGGGGGGGEVLEVRRRIENGVLLCSMTPGCIFPKTHPGLCIGQHVQGPRKRIKSQALPSSQRLKQFGVAAAGSQLVPLPRKRKRRLSEEVTPPSLARDKFSTTLSPCLHPSASTRPLASIIADIKEEFNYAPDMPSYQVLDKAELEACGRFYEGTPLERATSLLNGIHGSS